MVDGQMQQTSLASEFRKILSPEAVVLLTEMQDNPQWVEILHKLDDVRVRPWSPGSDVSQWAFDSGTVDGVKKAVEILRNISQE